jgi:mRNA interferase MazF
VIPDPWTVWWADLDPTEGHEQGGHRPVVVISSPLHVRLTRGELVTVAPITSRDRPTWLHRVPVVTPRGTSYVVAEQLRSIAVARLGDRPAWRLTPHEAAAVRQVLRRMVDF